MFTRNLVDLRDVTRGVTSQNCASPPTASSEKRSPAPAVNDPHLGEKETSGYAVAQAPRRAKSKIGIVAVRGGRRP